MATSVYEGSFESSGGGRISYFIMSPDGVPRAVVQICHGMNEYAGRYRQFSEYLAGHGFAVCGHDHMGHGSSAASDDDLGFIPRRGGAEILVSDTYNMTRIIAERFPKLPVFLLGHSMGSFIARLYITEHADALAGVILSGTGGPGQPAAAGRLLSRIIGTGSYGRRRSALIDKIAFGSYNKTYGAGVPKYAWLSRDPDIVEKYTNDRYCASFIFTTDAFYVLFSMLERVSAKKWAADVPRELPALLAGGTDDPVGNYGRGVREVYRRLSTAGVRDLTLRLYPQMRHEILNEIGRDAVYSDILGWICERLG